MWPITNWQVNSKPNQKGDKNMGHILVRHKVADFEKWKQVYDEHRAAREAAGLENLHLWRNEDDPNEVTILFEASDLAKAKALINSPDLKESMEASGVQGQPDMAVLLEA